MLHFAFSVSVKRWKLCHFSEVVYLLDIDITNYPFSQSGIRREAVLVHDDQDWRQPVLPHGRLQMPQAEPATLEQVLLLERKMRSNTISSFIDKLCLISI